MNLRRRRRVGLLPRLSGSGSCSSLCRRIVRAFGGAGAPLIRGGIFVDPGLLISGVVRFHGIQQLQSANKTTIVKYHVSCHCREISLEHWVPIQ